MGSSSSIGTVALIAWEYSQITPLSSLVNVMKQDTLLKNLARTSCASKRQ